MASKKALKSIQQLIKEGSHEGALHESTSLLKTLKEGPEAAQALCYRALVLTHLDRSEEAEKSYLHALKLQPNHPLAGKGLRKLYEKQEAWERLGMLLERSVDDAYQAGEAEQCAAALADLFAHRQQHGPEDRLYRALHLLLPSSPLILLLQPVTPPSDTFVPFPIPAYPSAPTGLPQLAHPLHLLGSLAVLLHLLIRQKAALERGIEADVKAARMKLGAKSEKETRRDVEAAAYSGEVGSGLVDLLREVAAHPGVDDHVRRLVEIEEFDYWKKLVGALSPSPAKTKGKGKEPAKDEESSLFAPPTHETPGKADALARADALANGFILLQLAEPAEPAYAWVLEGTDNADIYYPLDLLHQYAVKFPDSLMGGFIDDYCRWFHLAPPPAEEGEKARPTKKVKGMNARDRRKARRQAGREAAAEDVEAEERDELVASMTKTLDKLPKSIFAHRVMARISVQEEDWANAVTYAEKGRLLLKELEVERGVTLSSVRTSLDTALGVALVPYYPPKHHSRATRLLNGVLSGQPNDEARFARGQIFQYAQNWSEAHKTFAQIEGGAAAEEVGWCMVNEGKLEAGRDILEEVVLKRNARWEEDGSKEQDDAFGRARGWYRLGKTEWTIGADKGQAEEWFTASLRASPTFAPSYSALGTLFEDAGDSDRALKCFQKAFELDATEVQAAEKLARGYADDDEWAQVRAIATRVMEGEGGVEGVAGGDVMGKGRFAPKNGWAWKALGSTEMFYRNYVKAAQSYQVALRALPEDVPTHVLLAEAYIKGGKHMAALKTLDRVLELDPDHWIAKYDIALVHAELGNFGKAIEVYEGMPREVGVIAGLAGAWLSLGREMRDGGFRERATRAFKNAVSHAEEVIRMDRQYRTWGWKVVGDAAFEMDEADESVVQLLMKEDEDKRAVIPGIGEITDGARLAVYAYSWRAYLLRDERTPVVVSALYDLSAALHALAQTGVEEATKAAIGAVRRALDKDASDERLWTALGVLCESGPALAQHAFVVSLELYEKDPVTWTNLGYLYLRLDERDLANQCFLKAQTLDPDYARAWLGQGLLADRDGQKEHARNLFAHSVTLSAGGLLEADLAAAAAIFERHLRGDTSELHQPAFALRRYVHRRPHDSAAVHLYGLITERLGLTTECITAFESAVQLLEHEYEVSEDEAIERRYVIALVNLGRARLADKRYDEAIEAYTSAWDLLQSDDKDALRVQVRLGLALGKYWTGDVEGCLEEFEGALLEAEKHEGGTKEVVAVLLARTLWGLEDGKEVAKGHLLECLANPDLQVVAALGAIALLTEDEDLYEAVSAEIGGMTSLRGSDQRDHAGLVLATHALIADQPDGEEAVLHLAQSAQAMPDNTAVRVRLARMMLRLGKVEAARDVLSATPGGGASAETGGKAEEKAEVLGLRGEVRVRLDDEGGVGECVRAVRASPWVEDRWEGMEWAVRNIKERGAVGGGEMNGDE